MPFERLIQIVGQSQLTLVAPHKWEDPFEKYWTKVLVSDPKARKKALASVFGLCFSWESRSDALWRIYSPTQLGVRIEVSVQVLMRQLRELNNHLHGKTFFGKVNYLKDPELIERARGIRSNAASTPKASLIAKCWLHKRRAFSHEQEMRLLHVTNVADKTTDLLQVKVNPGSLIKSIRIDPRASPSVADAFCNYLQKKTGLPEKRIKQSNLYQLPEELETLIKA